MSSKDFDYKKAKQELNELIDWFESGEADLDQALENYNQAEKLINQLDDYLKDTEKKIKLRVKNK